MRSSSVEVGGDRPTITGPSAVTAGCSTADVIAIHEGGTGATVQAPGRTDSDSITIFRGVSDAEFDLRARGPVLCQEVELRLVEGAGLGHQTKTRRDGQPGS